MEKYTKYERARIIGARALQISMGAPTLLKLTKDDLERINYNPIEIAKLEFDKGIIPITIKRPLPERAEDTFEVLESLEKAEEEYSEEEAEESE